MVASPIASPTSLRLRGRCFDAGHPAVMGIINVTTDSFYAPARHSGSASVLTRIAEMIDEGVDIVDIGGVRAGQEGDWVDVQTEIARVRPVLAAARQAFPELPLSLDTWRSDVASACAGFVDLVNDTWADTDPDLVKIAADLGAGYVVSHTGGLLPRTDPNRISYGSDPDAVVTDVINVLSAGAARALTAGVAADRILLDPTLDFGKTTANSLRLVATTDRVVALGYPVLMAISRKDFVGETLDLLIDDRLEGTLAATAVAAWQGATVFRAHDVQATRRVIDMVASIRGDRPPAKAVRGL